MAYRRKAAGPYNPSMKYSGGIAIANQKNWLREARGRFGFGDVPGPAAEEIEDWFAKYGFGDPARWVAENFRFQRNKEWETRSKERCVGKACVSKCRSSGLLYR